MKKILTRVGVIAALIGLIGAIIVAMINSSAQTKSVAMIISATRTAEALATISKLTQIAEFTSTPPATSTSTPTETIAPTATSVLDGDPAFPSGYTIYDTFDKDTGSFSVSGNQAKCSPVYERGTLKIECFGSEKEGVNLTLFPAKADVLTPRGVAMAFYTLPQIENSNLWGKYQIQILYGPKCVKKGFERAYYISIRPNDLTFVEADLNYESINPPSPKVQIGTLEPHVIWIELENGQMNYYLDGTLIRSVIPVENTAPACWMFQSEDNDNHMADGYRGIGIMWIATKP